MSALFDWRQQTIVMGILNLTPDSFSGDGLLSQADYHEKALEQAACEITLLSRFCRFFWKERYVPLREKALTFKAAFFIIFA